LKPGRVALSKFQRKGADKQSHLFTGGLEWWLRARRNVDDRPRPLSLREILAHAEKGRSAKKGVKARKAKNLHERYIHVVLTGILTIVIRTARVVRVSLLYS
jgi:hypothetical protein